MFVLGHFSTFDGWERESTMKKSLFLGGQGISDPSALDFFPRVDPDDARRVHYVHVFLDNSGSMHSRRDPTCKALQSLRNVLSEGEKRLYEQTDGTVTLRASIKWLNGDWLVKDVSVYDLPEVTAEMYQCDGGTPLVRESVVTLQDLTSKVAERRDQDLSARGHLIWITDGEAGDMSDTARLDTLKHMVQSLLNPVTPTGLQDTQVFDFFAIPIGEKARGFYTQIGIRDEDIFDVPDTIGSRLEDALARTSLKILGEAGAVPEDLQLESSQEDADGSELNGDAILRFMRENRAALDNSSSETNPPEAF